MNEWNSRTDPVYSKITDEYLTPLKLNVQINNIVNGPEYLQWHANIDQIINLTDTKEISKINKVCIPSFALGL